MSTTFMWNCVLASTVSNDFSSGNSSDISSSSSIIIPTDVTTPASTITPNVTTISTSEPTSVSSIEGNLTKMIQLEPLGAAASSAQVISGPTYGSCYLELNTTGDLANSCLKKTNTDGSIVNVFLLPDLVKPADIGMYCSIWIKAKLCEIKSTCEKCPNEGALAEHFLKDSARRRYDKYCHNTQVTFGPLEVTLCDVTPSSKTGLIITVVVLVAIILGLCAFICFFAPIGGKGGGKGKGGGEKTTSSKAKQAGSASGGGGGAAGAAKGKPSKVK
ncbi:hypothetical protein TYRP_012124 [Tyrophagus putrescentiae]|nr:hypothetical protein TYRP_012124 [Tyrophagus putrescentiae]